MLEGGGDLNFSMLELGLIDEIYLTLCPFVFGGRTAPASFGGEGFTKEHVRTLGLKSYRLEPDDADGGAPCGDTAEREHWLGALSATEPRVRHESVVKHPHGGAFAQRLTDREVR